MIDAPLGLVAAYERDGKDERRQTEAHAGAARRERIGRQRHLEASEECAERRFGERLHAHRVTARTEGDHDVLRALLAVQDPLGLAVGREKNRPTVGVQEQIVDAVVLVAERLVRHEISAPGEHDGALVRAHHRREHVDAAQRLHGDVHALPALRQVEPRGGHRPRDGRLGRIELPRVALHGQAMLRVRFEEPPLVSGTRIRRERRDRRQGAADFDVGAVTRRGQHDVIAVDAKPVRSRHFEHALAERERHAHDAEIGAAPHDQLVLEVDLATDAHGA